MQLSDALQVMLTGDNASGLDQSKLNLGDSACERALTGIGTNACCGHAPNWQLFNVDAQVCVDGELQDI